MPFLADCQTWNSHFISSNICAMWRQKQLYLVSLLRLICPKTIYFFWERKLIDCISISIQHCTADSPEHSALRLCLKRWQTPPLQGTGSLGFSKPKIEKWQREKTLCLRLRHTQMCSWVSITKPSSFISQLFERGKWEGVMVLSER